MAHALRDKKTLLTRIRRIRGQTEALERALESDADCSAVLQQVAAIRGAANGLMTQLLEGHLTEHLGRPDASPRERSEDVAQVISIIRSYLK